MGRPRDVALGALVLGALLALGACAQDEPGPEPVDERAEDPETGAEPEHDPGPELRVVAKLAPIADLVAMVGGDRVEVDRLVPPGADSHTYEPRPGDVAALADADVFIGVGLELNPGAVSLAAENLPEDAVVLLGERYLDDDALVFDHLHDHDHDHPHDDGHSHGHDEDGDGAGPGPNPHVWTSLTVAADLVDGIADTLAELDPEGAPAYLGRAGDARAELEGLHERVGEAMATVPAGNRTLIVYHDAWSYFARDYGLELVTAVQPSDYSEPSAGEIREIVDLVREHDVPALFGSEVFPSEVLEVIAEETGAVYVGDLADDELPGEPGEAEHTYPGLMQRNARLVVEHLGGDAELLRD